MIKVHVVRLLGVSGYMPPQENFGFFSDLLRSFSSVILGVKLQKLDDLLINLVVVFEAHRIKGMTPLQAAVVISVRHGEISGLILITYHHP